jgi:hypothetical protein
MVSAAYRQRRRVVKKRQALSQKRATIRFER